MTPPVVVSLFLDLSADCVYGRSQPGGTSRVELKHPFAVEPRRV